MFWEAALVIVYTFAFVLASLALFNEHSPLSRLYKSKRTFFFTTNRLQLLSEPPGQGQSLHDTVIDSTVSGLASCRKDDIHPYSQPETLFSWELHDAQHLCTSFLSDRHGPDFILAYRIFALSYFFLGLLFQGLAPNSLATGLHADFLPFFTNWTYIGFGLYAALGVAVSVRARRSATARLDSGAAYHNPLGMYTPPAAPIGTVDYDALDKAFVAVLLAMSSSAVLLTSFYWLVLYNGGTVLVENAMKHGINVVIFVGEFLVSRVPVATSWAIFSISYSTLYGVFMWVRYAIEHKWVYAVLNWNKAGNLPYYVILPPLGLAAFFSMFLVASLRESIATGKGMFCCGRFSKAEELELCHSPNFGLWRLDSMGQRSPGGQGDIELVGSLGTMQSGAMEPHNTGLLYYTERFSDAKVTVLPVQ